MGKSENYSLQYWKETVLMCLLCANNVPRPNDELLDHLLNKHTSFCKICRLCGRYFFTDSDFEVHVKKHKSSQEHLFKCAICASRSFFNKKNLLEHQSKHNNRSNYIDGFIMKQPFEEKQKKTPEKNETKYKNDILKRCLEGVVDNISTLTQISENSTSPNKSDEFQIEYLDPNDPIVNFTETNEHESNSNLEKKSPEIKKPQMLRMLECEQCGQMFSNEKFLSRHLENHRQREQILKYHCQYCKVRYPVPGKLFEHLRKKHKAKKPFCCQLCSLYFPQIPQFSEHIKSLHCGEGKEGILKFLPDGLIVYMSQPPNTSIIQETDANNIGNAIEIDTQLVYDSFDLNNASKNDKTKEQPKKKYDLSKDVGSKSNVLEDTSFKADVSKDVYSKTNVSKDVTSKTNVSKDVSSKTDFSKDTSSKTGILKGIVSRKDTITKIVDLEDEVSHVSEVFDISTSDEISPVVIKPNKPSIKRGRPRKRKLETNSESSLGSWDEEDKMSLSKLKKTDYFIKKPTKRIKYEYCEICDAKLLKSSIKRHTRLHSVKKRFKCHLCGLSVKEESKFHLHMKRHFENDAFLCICGAKMNCKKSFDEHRRKFHAKVSDQTFTTIKYVTPSSKDGKSQILLKKVNERPHVFNVTSTPKGGYENTFKKLLDLNAKRVENSERMSFTIKKISYAEAKRKMLIKPIPMKSVATNFIEMKQISDSSVSDVSASPAKVSTNVKRKGKYLNVNVNKNVVHNKLENIKIVHSNPLAHLTKERIKEDGLVKGKKIDYESIIKDSLADIFK